MSGACRDKVYEMSKALATALEIIDFLIKVLLIFDVRLFDQNILVWNINGVFS